MIGVGDQCSVFPGNGLSDFQRKLVLADRTEDQEDGGVVIQPDPAIVIKTLILKERRNHLPLDDCVDDSYLPRTLSSIYAASSDSDADNSETNDDIKGKAKDTKVFLNICTHPLIAVPGKRKGLDEGAGKEVDGWRLPMSLGELRPCYDKMGRTAIAADCVLNPSVVREMNSDSNYFHCVCDVIVQCASRKFRQTWFGGHDLDTRFKVPKMKYAGYVDEITGLPAMPEGDKPINGSVAKQRVKGHGGKSSIIEEFDCSPSERRSNNGAEDSAVATVSLEYTKADGCRIELYISYNQNLIPLFDFLTLASELDEIVPRCQPSSTLREIIKSPKLKSSDKDGCFHVSQRLVAPIPIDTAVFLNAVAESVVNPAETCDERTENRLDQFSIIAKCSIKSNTPTSSNHATIPTVELSAFTLFVSSVECVLPFPVDVTQTTIACNGGNGVIEIRMPILQYSGPDPGTRQWELQKAFSGGDVGTTVDGRTVSRYSDLGGRTSEKAHLLGNSSGNSILGTYFQDVDDEDEDIDNSQPLAEDAFHSCDVLSRHFLHQQEEERRARRGARNENGRDGADVEYMNVDEIRGNQSSAKNAGVSPTLKVAENVLKNRLHDHYCREFFVMGLV